MKSPFLHVRGRAASFSDVAHYILVSRKISLNRYASREISSRLVVMMLCLRFSASPHMHSFRIKNGAMWYENKDFLEAVEDVGEIEVSQPTESTSGGASR